MLKYIAKLYVLYTKPVVGCYIGEDLGSRKFLCLICQRAVKGKLYITFGSWSNYIAISMECSQNLIKVAKEYLGPIIWLAKRDFLEETF